MVKIWKDNWILTSPDFKPLSPRHILNENSTVRDLIDQDLGKWNVGTINEIFNQNEALQITSIPLSRSVREDKLIRNFETDDDYSIKTTYHYQKNLNCRKSPSQSSNKGNGMWKKFWKIPLEAKRKTLFGEQERTSFPLGETFF